MKKALLETAKGMSLILLIIIGVIIFDQDPIEAKARKVQDRKGNLAQELSREERDEYMKYLRTLNNFNHEDPVYKKEITDE